MKQVIKGIAILGLLLVPMSIADAASIRVGASGGRNFSIFLAGESDNGNFDTIIFRATPCPLTSFGSLDPDGADGFAPRGPGDAFTYISPFLGAPPAFGGNGHSILGAVVSEDVVEFTSGPLGQQIDTENGPNTSPSGLFLANLVTEGTRYGGQGNVEVQLVSAGTVVGTLGSSLNAALCHVPEPSSLTLVGLALTSVFGVRRRRC